MNEQTPKPEPHPGTAASAITGMALAVAAVLQVIGSTLRARPAAEKAQIVQAFEERFGPDLAAGRIRPVVDRVLPLEQVAEAHRAMKASEHFGKIVLAIS